MIHPSDLPHLDAPPVDFRRSIPPRIASIDTHLSSALAELAERGDLNQLMRQSVARGSDADRAAGQAWLTPRFGDAPDASRIVVTNGTQNTVLMLLRVLVGSGGVLLAERLSYGVLRALSRLAGIEVYGVEIDDEGLVPDALDAACRRFRPKALYCNPTVHNPTTSILSARRRLEIAEIARRYDIAIIEDDALGRLHANSPPPIAALAPDITWYITTMTKSLTQGWRLAYLVTPDQPLAQRRLAPIENLSCWHCSPLVAAITNLWVANGTAAQIADEIAQECLIRERIARQMFAELDARSVPGSMHLWLRLPDELPRADVIAKAERLGVLLRPADMFAVDDQPAPNALRLSLSPPETLDQVRRGLRSIRHAIDSAS